MKKKRATLSQSLKGKTALYLVRGKKRKGKKKGDLYTGIARDPWERFDLHGSGGGALFTKMNGAEELECLLWFRTRKDAAGAERLVKKKRKWKKERLVEACKDVPDGERWTMKSFREFLEEV